MQRFTVNACVPVILAALALPVRAAVDISVAPVKVTKEDGGTRRVQAVTLANEIAQYTLTYDVVTSPDKPGQAWSHWWAWKGKWVSIGMTEPAKANWYWQAFFNWHFDDESIYNRPAAFRVVRQSGRDGLVEYSWDTPKAKVAICFGLTTASDKLLMFGRYEPKTEIKRSYLRLNCYPAAFAKPRNRAVTTAAGTTPAGGSVTLDLAKQRWALYEDVTKGRPGCGPAGLVVGTPDAFAKVDIPVGAYGITTRLDLKPDKRSFALALYSFPPMPDVAQTRDYFRATADRDAQWLERTAATYLDQTMPPLPVPEERHNVMRQALDKLFSRPVERWSADPARLKFDWARKLPGGPIRTVFMARRFAAYESMELARRLDLDVRHVYFDSSSQISSIRAWPYRHYTGIGPAGLGAASIRAARLCMKPDVELFLICGLSGKGVPGGAKQAILQQVRDGKALMLVSSRGWPKELFAQPDPELAESVLSAFSWADVPGYREGERGRVGADAPLAAYRYGKGRVLQLKVKLNTYSCLVPRNDASEGLDGATDRCLAFAAKAALAAARPGPTCKLELGKPAADAIHVRITPTPPANAALVARVQDDLDRVLMLRRVALPLDGDALALPSLPAGRRCFLDVSLRDAQGRCLDFASVLLPNAQGPTLGHIALSPATRMHEPAPPRVELPDGGKLSCRVEVKSDKPIQRAAVRWEVRDAVGRVLARAESAVNDGAARATLRLNRPVVVCCVLDVALVRGDRELAFARQRFTMPVAYPYDDFTALVWSYAGGDPVLLRTNRLCYDMGADMQDICHMRGYTDAGAAREYSVAARSGLRLVPYVTRLAGKADESNFRRPCLHDPAYFAKERDSIVICSRQAAPYGPAAFTLGDENYLYRGPNECCHRPESVAAFREWLEKKYQTVDALNRAWATSYAGFAAITKPMLLAETAQQTNSFAPWLDHKRFMDTAFARAHERFADVVRQQAPGAKVGWDGFLGYTWKAGYDFTKLTRNLELNQTYVRHWLQGALVRSFKRSDALTGSWGNGVADNEEGWSAWPWHCIFNRDNSVWWWTSWGCDYIPFSPDLSVNDFGRWFFAAVNEVKAGPGKLLLHAEREHSRIAVLYSQPDMFASEVAKQFAPKACFSGSRAFWGCHRGLLKAITDLGFQYQHVAYSALERGELSREDYDVVCLCLASCLSDNQVAALRRFVESGGTLVVDGRAGLLTGDGAIRATRPLDDILGVKSAAGLGAFKQPHVEAEATLDGRAGAEPIKAKVRVLEPGISLTTGKALGRAGRAPVAIINEFGKGAGVLLNMDWAGVVRARTEQQRTPQASALAAVLRRAGLRPICELRAPDGESPVCSERVLFSDGGIRYLGVERDLLVVHLPAQKLRVKLREPTIVYDVRAGKRLGDGKLAEWDVELSRGRPLLYALMPYAVTAVRAQAPASANTGHAISVAVQVQTEGGPAEYHVVRLNVYAPGSDAPHRQYSQNIACPGGKGSATIPFALSDAVGQWRLEFRDAATGVTASRTLALTN